MDGDGSETNKLVSNIADISIKEESSNTSSSSSSTSNTGLLWKDGLPNDSNSRKEGTIGSLSFSVVNTASNQPSELSSKLVPSNAENSPPQESPEQMISAKKPIVRTKVPFEKGYSQMDWLKLTRTHPDLAGSHAEVLMLIVLSMSSFTEKLSRIIFSHKLLSNIH